MTAEKTLADGAGFLLIEDAGRVLAEARALLAEAAAEPMDATLAPLERAARLLGEAVEELRRNRLHGDARMALARLRKELALVRALHRNAGALAAGWMQVLGGLAGADYSPRGGPDWPELASPGHRVSVEG